MYLNIKNKIFAHLSISTFNDRDVQNVPCDANNMIAEQASLQFCSVYLGPVGPVQRLVMHSDPSEGEGGSGAKRNRTNMWVRLDDLYEDALALFETEGDPSSRDLPSTNARNGNASVGKKGRFSDACDTEGMKGATMGPHGEGFGAGGERLRNAQLRSVSSSGPSPHTVTSISQVQCPDNVTL
jgi:hypothetical protein